jgi:AraC-like DNA-binding protein
MSLMHAPHGQTYRERRPVPALADHITSVWFQRVLPEAVPYTHHSVPNGSADLVCVVGSTPRLVGPQTGPVTETLTPGTTVVGVRFRPGAAPSVLGLPASELVDQSVEWGELGNGSAAALGERVAGASSPAEAAAAVEQEILARMADASALDPIAAEAVERLLPWRATDVASLTQVLYISERQLRRRLEGATGFSPKVLQRMLRFQGFLALANARERPSEDLARLAAEAGYADQSHLTRESVRLAGRSPRTVLLEAEHDCASNHDHTASYEPLRAGLGDPRALASRA